MTAEAEKCMALYFRMVYSVNFRIGRAISQLFAEGKVNIVE